jgi:hypothetical protein
VPEPVSRRWFLAGAAALAAAAACGSDDDDGRPAISVPDDTDDTSNAEQVNLLIGTFNTLAGRPDERVALLVVDGDRKPVTSDAAVTVRFGDAPQSRTLGPPLPAERHTDGLLTPYYLVKTQFPAPGAYAIQADVGGKPAMAAVEVIDPARDATPKPGERLIATPTPTPADKRGVDPICTREPECPLHDVSLDVALGEGRPLAVLFATPAFCQTATCGPVLDVLLKEREAFADKVRFVHVEIFKDRNAKETAPAVGAYKLQNEPWLYLAGADGVIRERLAGPYDRVELRGALQRLTAQPAD